MKKILFLTHMYPYPPNDGGKIVTYNTLKALEENNFDLTILSFFSKKKDLIDQFPISCNLHLLPLNYSNSKLKAFKNVFSKYSYNMQKYINHKMSKLIIDKLYEESYDLVYVDHLHMAYYAKIIRKQFPKLKIILRQHNIESSLMKRVYKEQKNGFYQQFFKMQYIKLFNYESKIVNFFDECILISKEDYDQMKKMNENVNLSVLPAGVDTNKYYPMTIKLVNRPTITFLGSMSWLPNVDGISWFVNEIFPNLLKVVPDVLFYIVGKDPNQEIINFQRRFPNNIIVTGFVEDERPYISTSDVFIVPLKIGGGMRIKILNALSMEKPVVTTSIGVEGIHIKKNSFVLADTNEDFLKGILNVLNYKEKSKNMALLGHKEVVNKYSNHIIYNNHIQYLENVINRAEL